MKILSIIILAVSLTFIGCSSEGDQNNNQHEQDMKEQVYYCPMHPEVTSDKPGVCPICHMDLVLKTDDEDSSADMDEMLKINASKQFLANVSTVKVSKQKILKTVSAYSYLDFAEPNQRTITARFNGRIEKLFVDKVGSVVKIGDPLFQIYSSDLVQAQNDFVVSLNNSSQFKLISNGEGEINNLLATAKTKLKLFGLTEKQIDDLKNSKIINYSITYFSPFAGTIIDKKIQEGVYVNEGSLLYEITDLSLLWNLSDVFEQDITFIKQGSKAQLELDSYPGRIFNGSVSLVYPVVDQQTRTVKVRSAFANSNGLLKPNMYGTTKFEADAGIGLVVPVDAVLMTGKRNVVWVKVSEKGFQPRDVVLGYRFNDKYQIISGLNEGDEIAATGGYLIDSESQLQGGTAVTHQHGDEKPEVKKLSNTNNHDEHIVNENKSAPIGSTSSVRKEIFNAYCPVLGGKVSQKVKTVEYKGKLIGFCCAGCDEDFLNDPELYMKNLSSDGKKFIGETE